MLDLRPTEDGQPFRVDRYQLTPVEMSHTVPCRGYLVEDGADKFLIAGDTGPTDAVWALANATVGLRGMILECSFPDKLADLAHTSRHLTPTTLQLELRKLKHDIPIYITHMKPGYEVMVRDGVAQLRDDRLHMLDSGQTIDV